MTVVKTDALQDITAYSKALLAMTGTPVPANAPKVLNKHHLKGGTAPNSVYIGRGSPYGNPFRIGVHGSRAEVIRRFEAEVLPNLDVSALRGKDLVCFCKPAACHGDPILRKANLPYDPA